MNQVTSTKEIYTQKAVPGIREALGIQNPMAIPRIEKIVVNTGIGKILKDSKQVEEIVSSLQTIVGQKVVMTKARKAIAGFKIREGLEVGVSVTLHGKRMWDFLDRLLNTSIPRARDFQGLSGAVIDQYGNVNIGIKDHTIFPEIVPEKVQHIFGFQVNIVTTAQNREEGTLLFRFLGLPIAQKEAEQKGS
ncbi:MAG: 50S ribosomal protein L5 [Candidatus Moranbacteria bacterium]|jgi:large subunit ribosomal protein L5|nr:50S ribosomal protein L5 [Candidatus Moranbacteria bacterium]MBP9801157.1 50S ribosomal protein L5 [Candidatus Moranbacteria bacterium]